MPFPSRNSPNEWRVCANFSSSWTYLWTCLIHNYSTPFNSSDSISSEVNWGCPRFPRVCLIKRKTQQVTMTSLYTSLNLQGWIICSNSLISTVAATVVTLLVGLISLKGFASKLFTPYPFWFGQQSELLFKKKGPSHHFLSSSSLEALHPRDAMSAGFSGNILPYIWGDELSEFYNSILHEWFELPLTLCDPHNAISESSQQTHLFIFRDRSSALGTLEISLASTNADSSSNLCVVAPVMGDTLVFEATRLQKTEFPDCILR